MSETLIKFREAILAYNAKGAMDFATKAIEEGVDPLNIADTGIEVLKQIGDSFGRGDAWLPDLIGASNAMTNAMSVVDKELKRRGKKRHSLGTIVIGTVYGDIHNIGKDMVATLAAAEGFEIIDLGVDVKSEVFMEAIREHKPEILAMSALLTTTAPEQGKVIKMLKDEGFQEKVKVVVGGGAITSEFATSIGADGYGPTAPMGVKLFKKILGKGE
jgi:methanogenic corrinoid protein MtbC1